MYTCLGVKLLQAFFFTDELAFISVKEDVPEDDDAVFIESQRGNTILQFRGFRYRKAYKSKAGYRWVCSLKKNCNAFVYLNHNDEIILSNEDHSHEKPSKFDYVDSDQNDSAVMITSRKGKEIMLFRQYTYRKQYVKKNRARWVCSNLKNCRGCVFTDENGYITSSFEQHCHPPPKYYLKPGNVIGALRERVVVETD